MDLTIVPEGILEEVVLVETPEEIGPVEILAIRPGMQAGTGHRGMREQAVQRMRERLQPIARSLLLEILMPGFRKGAIGRKRSSHSSGHRSGHSSKGSPGHSSGHSSRGSPGHSLPADARADLPEATMAGQVVPRATAAEAVRVVVEAREEVDADDILQW
ncbi:MAG TPA: hypothetical protein VHM93_01595 [Candidatus Acidoferrum sp.]|jgi:hypothetical protein|nr:hypothetical protein [Candidatus Acidoferrum sp.]